MRKDGSYRVWKSRELTDKSDILAYLETDRLYAAYAIGDLDQVMFEETSWAGAEEAGRLRALALSFRGLEPPALFLMGDPDGLRVILEYGLHPERAYLTCRSTHLAAAGSVYRWEELTSMWRMAIRPADFRPAEGDSHRLAPAQSGQLAKLYALGGADAFSPAQMEHGVFYGVAVERRLVAAAGTHLVSPTYGVAAVGNVFTHPNHRCRGYATVTIGAVVAELVRLGIRDIVLNVSQSNGDAIRIYERLGFERYCAFVEGPAVLRRNRRQRPKWHRRDIP
jgi:GNAT superfamily N-acetyltransferase